VGGLSLAAIACGLAACRFGFDARALPDGGGDGGSDASVDAMQFAANVAFVTSTMHATSALTLADADAICQVRADANNLAGTFVAWLSTTSTSAIDRLPATGGFVRLDGEVIARSKDELVTRKLLHPVQFDEAGTALPIGTGFATGTSGDGTLFAGQNCSDFTGSGTLSFGCSDGTGDQYTSCFISGCIPTRLLCIQTDRTETPVVATTTGRVAFVAPFKPGMGTASADAKCATEAAGKQLPGTYKALIATTTASAASRFSPAGPTWVRLDGVSLAPTAADVLAGNFTAPLNVRPDLSYDNFAVFTGAPTISDVGTDASTCSNWVSGNTRQIPITGRSSRLHPAAFDDAIAVACSTTQSVYCLEE
jgi:hypothetical protein